MLYLPRRLNGDNALYSPRNNIQPFFSGAADPVDGENDAQGLLLFI